MQPHQILIVDDDENLRFLNTEALSGFGYIIEDAEDGAAAWEKIQLKTYNLIITDNTMPRMSGLELLKKLHAAGVKIPVIMATGTPPENEFDANPSLRPRIVLRKPYVILSLINAVKEILP